MFVNSFVVEDGKQREVIRIACDNDAGFRIGYRDTLRDGEAEYQEPKAYAAKVSAVAVDLGDDPRFGAGTADSDTGAARNGRPRKS